MNKGVPALRIIDKAIGRIEYALAAASGLALGAILLIISIDVIGRTLRWISIPWTVEFAQYWLIAGTFLSAGWLYREHAHPRVSALDGIRQPLLHRAVLLTSVFLALAAAVFGLYFALEIVSTQFERGTEVGVFVRVPRWLVLSPLPIGFALLLYESIATFLRKPERSLA